MWRGLLAGGLLAAVDGHAQLPELNREWNPPVSPGGFITSSPALSPDGSRIFVGVHTNRGADGQVIAITREGAPAWPAPFARPEAITATPAVSADGSTVYIGCLDTTFHALNAATGAIRWVMRTDGFIHSSAAIGQDGTVYVGSADGKLYAFDGVTGTKRWDYKTDDWIWSSPAVGADGTIYVGSFDRHLYAITPEGELKWRAVVGGRIFTSPAIATDGTIYIGSSEDQRLHAINPDGTKKWDHFVNGDIQASPVLGADGTIYFAATDQHFYALNPGGPDDFRRKWRRETPGTNSISTAVVRGDGKIIFGADDGKLRALDPEDGKVFWTFDTAESEIESSAIVAPDGSIYFASDFLYKLRGNRSPVSELSSWPAFRGRATRAARAERFSEAGQLVNLSIRAQVATDQTLIVGFAVQTAGEIGRVHLLRAVGPTLANFGVGDAMPDPQLRLFSGFPPTPFPGGANNNWDADEPRFFGLDALVQTTAQVGAFALPNGSRDASMLVPLPAGLFSTHATAADGQGGIVLVEAYDARLGGAARLVNLSARHRAGSGENVLIAGFVVGGTERTRLLLRGVGPGLAQFGIPGFLPQPTLELYTAPGAGMSPQLVRPRNVGWTSEGLAHDIASAAARVGAFMLPNGSADCAMIVALDPGGYTLQISGLGGTTGEALAEIYVLP